MTFTKYDDLISNIYRAGFGTQRWSEPLSKLADMTSSSNAVAHVADVRSSRLTPLALLDDGRLDHSLMGVFGEFVDLGIEPRFRYMKQMIDTGRQTVCFSDQDFIDSSEMGVHPYYAEALAPLGLRFASVDVSTLSRTTYLGIALQRSPSRGPLPKRHLSLLNRASIHIRNAFAIETALKVLDQSTNRSAQSGAIVQGDGLVILESEQFIEHLVKPGLCEIKNGFLRMASVEAKNSLRKSVSAALRGCVNSFCLSDHRLRITVMPIPCFDEVFWFSKSAVRVLVNVEPVAHESAPSAFARIYGLTASEKTVLELLCLGHSLKRIALVRCVSVWTVRTQLRSIFQKTGTRSQIELLAKLSSS